MIHGTHHTTLGMEAITTVRGDLAGITLPPMPGVGEAAGTAHIIMAIVHITLPIIGEAIITTITTPFGMMFAMEEGLLLTTTTTTEQPTT